MLRRDAGVSSRGSELDTELAPPPPPPPPTAYQPQIISRPPPARPPSHKSNVIIGALIIFIRVLCTHARTPLPRLTVFRFIYRVDGKYTPPEKAGSYNAGPLTSKNVNVRDGIQH